MFLNACGSAAVDVFSASSFVKLFIENGNRGFLGTETRVPDTFAAKLSRRFYQELLTVSLLASRFTALDGRCCFITTTRSGSSMPFMAIPD